MGQRTSRNGSGNGSHVVAAQPQGLELYGVGARRRPLRVRGQKAEALTKLGIESEQDLLQHFPRSHVDRSELLMIADLRERAAAGATKEVSIHARVERIDRPIRLRDGKRTMIRGKIADETGTLDVTWFNQNWVSTRLKPGMYAFFYGRLSSFRGKVQMMAPRFELIRDGQEPFNVGRIIPMYPATADLSTDKIRRLLWDTLSRTPEILDPLPPDLARRLGYMSRDAAVRTIHFPETREDVMRARNRLVFDEVFTLQLGLVYRKRLLERTVQGISHPIPDEGSVAETFIRALPFELTNAQRRACEEVARDMNQRYPMHRLIEGEVGSGKTVVALYACLTAIGNGHQAAFMAPTEVLAEQHHLTVNELLDRAFGSDEGRNLFAGLSKRPTVRLLTGATPAVQREQILNEVAYGEVDLLLGTHSLIQDAVEFYRLGVAIVDEQHRFGVHQRKRLREKAAVGEPDVLVMTATPIPRTLAVSIFGDLDVSVLDELPKGRRPIQTEIAAGDEDRERAYALIRDEVAAGRQAYIVYALRDESDKTELRSAKSEAKRLAADVFPDLRVGLVHGDMKSSEKEAAMGGFRDGETQVLVATTVIEVGVDVPNATVMLIEDADRFGLAQLHQLRGRIGRGEHQSYCVLATDLDLSKEDDAAVAMARERLVAVASTRDGFKLALTDLEQRGEGQLFGARQSGVPQLKIARVLRHQDVVIQARDEAVRLLDEDPELQAHEHQALAREMRDRFSEETLAVVQSG